MRDTFSPDYTIGRLAIDGRSFGFVVEDTDRGLDQGMELHELAARKVKERTAIPAGVYELGVRYSPSQGREVIYLVAVPAFQFVLVHSGNTAADTAGCLCVGLHRGEPGHVTDSRRAVAWLELYYLEEVRRGGSSIRVSRAVTT